MTDRPLRRGLRFTERQWPWLLLSLLAFAATVALGASAHFGLLEALGVEAALRGHTVLGGALGVAAVLLVVIAGVYSARKRSLQEWMPLRGTLMAWLGAHVWLGLLALGVALVHAGFGAFSLELSTGKVLLFVLLVIVGSGLAWRVVYFFVPAAAARAVGNYSAVGSSTRADELAVELAKAAAGRSRRFQELLHWATQTERRDDELSNAATELPADEQQPFLHAARLGVSRQRAETRQQLQEKYTRRLQWWRVLHVPLTLLFFALLPLHLLGAYELPARLLPLGALGAETLGGFESHDACADCHESIVKQWKGSMHAHGMKSPLMIAQNNQVTRGPLAGATRPDPAQVCVNCHGPLGTAVAPGTLLPLESSSGNATLPMEGISCAVCHQWEGTPRTASAGFVEFQQGLRPGRTYFGPRKDPVPNAFHKSEHRPIFDAPSELCRNCHNVQMDRDGDGVLVRGTDLVLQTLYDEWKHYSAATSCVECHMPVVADLTRSADGAIIGLQQDREAPERRVRDHSFIGPDYPLDVSPSKDPHRSRRDTLLRRAASIAIDPASVSAKRGVASFEVTITNSGTGHNLPGGFAFFRQMWFEVKVTDARGELLASSGVLAAPTDDLCDASVLDDAENPMARFMEGCTASDPQLVNFQQQLIDKIEVLRGPDGVVRTDDRGQNLLQKAPDGKETWIQWVTAGPVARVRPFDKKPTTTLFPGEERKFRYALPVAKNAAGGRVSVRLLFRPTPPYFVRALGAHQPPDEVPKVAPLVANIIATEMQKAEATLPR